MENTELCHLIPIFSAIVFMEWSEAAELEVQEDLR